MTRNTPRTDEELWALVDRSGGPAACWLWQGPRFPNGYGQLSRRHRSLLAHRWSYENLVGPIPSGMVLDHVRERGCVNRHCVNPAHLEPVTNRTNLLRGTGFAATNAQKTHCIHGHEFTPENTKHEKLGRKCRTCDRTNKRIRLARRRELRLLGTLAALAYPAPAGAEGDA